MSPTPSVPRQGDRHLVMLQFAGDHREAYQRLADGGVEHYHAQRYCVDAVSDLKRRHPRLAVTVVTLVTTDRHDEVLPDGVRAVGLGLDGDALDHAAIVRTLESLRPTELVLRTANRQALQWALDRGVEVFALLAESLARSSWRMRWRAFRTSRLLADPRVRFVAAYGRTSANGYARLGIARSKIVPWDFLLETTPVAPARHLVASPADGLRLFFAGALDPAKGVDDLLHAHARLVREGLPVRLGLAGVGDLARYEALARSIGSAESVEFLGRIPASQIEVRMAQAHAVVVPSRHEYPEGFPLVIHHALRTSTPLVTSDHPMFGEVLRHGENAMVFRSGDPDQLAAHLRALLTDGELYARLSARAGPTWRALRLPVKWADVLHAWADRELGGDAWLRGQALDPQGLRPSGGFARGVL